MIITETTLRDYFDTYIKVNGRKEITASHINYSLSNLLSYVTQEDTNIAVDDLLITDTVRSLYLSGLTSAEKFLIRDSSGMVVFSVLGDGQVFANASKKTGSTSFGSYAGVSSTGVYQTAIGVQAGFSNTGVYQTAIGVQAGFSNTGACQTAIGVKAGFSNTGAFNTNIGFEAGYKILGGVEVNVSSDNSVFLGCRTRANAIEETNQIVIGAYVTGNGSDTSTIGSSNTLNNFIRGNHNIDNGKNIVIGTDTGTMLGTNTVQKLGFWGVTPVVQQRATTGTGLTVDELITKLQRIGILKN